MRIHNEINNGGNIEQLSYSVRRYFVDEFLFREVEQFTEGSKILDMGGKKKNKRGYFDIEKYSLNVEYANLDIKTEPDYLCDLTKVPVEDNSFYGVILSEVLEHIPEPELVLREAKRVLKPGGIALICVPFMYHRHADPFDFWRFSDTCLNAMLTKTGFSDIKIEKQGLFFSVLVYMLKIWMYEYNKDGRFRSKLVIGIISKLIALAQKKALMTENKEYYKNHKVFSSFTTGYGITARKI